MQTSELKHAATAPFRMLRMLEEFSHRNHCLEYVSRKEISIRDPRSKLFLVPGGRHLVVFSRKGLEICDLETNYHSENLIKNQVFLPEDATFCAVAQHSNPGKGAFRIVTQCIKNEGGERCVVYQNGDTRSINHFLQLLRYQSLRLFPLLYFPNDHWEDTNSRATGRSFRSPRRSTHILHAPCYWILEFCKWSSIDLDAAKQVWMGKSTKLLHCPSVSLTTHR